MVSSSKDRPETQERAGGTSRAQPGVMRDVNDRVQYLERRMEDHAALMADIRSEMAALRVAVDGGFTRLDEKIDGGFARLDRKFDDGFVRLDQKFDDRFVRLDQKFDGGFARLDQKTDRHFMWLVGIVLTAFTAVFAAFIGMAYR